MGVNGAKLSMVAFPEVPTGLFILGSVMGSYVWPFLRLPLIFLTFNLEILGSCVENLIGRARSRQMLAEAVSHGEILNLSSELGTSSSAGRLQISLPAFGLEAVGRGDFFVV